MAIDETVEAQILRYHFVEKWGPHTIAKQLGVHHYTVSRVIHRSIGPPAMRLAKPSILDPFKPFISEILERHPKLTAQRIYQMIKARGYPGGPSHLRQYVAQVRAPRKTEAFLRLKTLPGEQGQVDWGHFGHITIGKARRSLMAFVMVLSHSRYLFVKFYLNHQMGNFIRGHKAAFAAFEGVPKVLLYDNLKSAVLERHGDIVQFNPTMLDLAKHYRFEPRPVSVARGNEKGRVERSIRYLRDSFFSARSFADLGDLNRQAAQWLSETANVRTCPGADASIQEIFEHEKRLLLALPDNPFEDEDIITATVGKTPYIRFDLNDYSVPHEHVRQSLTIRASGDAVRIFCGSEQIAQHQRSYNKGESIEDPKHIDALRRDKRFGKKHSRKSQLIGAVPQLEDLLMISVQRGHNLGRAVQQFDELYQQYGRAEFTHAVTEALTAKSPHPNSLRQILQRRKDEHGIPPSAPLKLQHEQAQRVIVAPPSLCAYSRLTDYSHDNQGQTASKQSSNGDKNYE
jgi:transposase